MSQTSLEEPEPSYAEQRELYLVEIRKSPGWSDVVEEYSLPLLEEYVKVLRAGKLEDEAEIERKRKQRELRTSINRNFYKIVSALKKGIKPKDFYQDADFVSICTQYNEIYESTRKVFEGKNYIMQIGTSYDLSRQDLAEGFNQLHDFLIEKYKDLIIQKNRIIYCKSLKGDKVEISFNYVQLRHIAVHRAKKKNAASIKSPLPDDVTGIRKILGKHFKESFTTEEKLIIRKNVQFIKEEIFLHARQVDLKTLDKTKEFSLEPIDLPLYEDVGIVRLIMPKECTTMEWQLVLGGLVEEDSHQIIKLTDLIDEGISINVKEYDSLYMLIAFNSDKAPTKRYFDSWWNYKAKLEVLTRVTSRRVQNS